MVSQQMLALGKQSSKIRAISEYGTKRKQEIGADKVFDFSLGNPSIPAPEAVRETMIRLLQDTDSTKLHGYTSSAGDPVVRNTIAAYLQQVHNSLRRSVGRILVQMNCVVDSRPMFVIPKIPPTLIVPSSEEDNNTVLSKFQQKLVISCSCPNMI